MTLLARVADRVLNRPLLITPAKAQVILSVLSGRIGIQSPEASRFVGSNVERTPEGTKWKPYRVTPEGVGIITIDGSLINRGAWIGADSGLVSYEGIQFQTKAIGADDAVASVILDINSPGGEAIGAFETAAMVRELSAKKPTVAIVNGMAASAAYAIASGAREIVTTPTGVSGSIGVVLLHADYSKMLAADGIKPTLIFAGAHKVDGNPFEPLSEAVQEDLQAEVNAFYELFLSTVAEGGRLSVDEARATEARAPIGQAAVDMKLADRIGTFESVLAELTQSKTSRAPTPGRSTSMKGKSMDKQEGAPAADDAGTISKADLDKAVTEAVAKGLEEGRKAEAARLSGIEANLIGGLGLETLIAAHKADATMTPEKSAVAVVATLKTLKLDALKGLAKLDKAAEGVVSRPSATGDHGKEKTPAATTPEGWKAEWAESDELKSEFVTAEDYAGFRQAEASGKVKVLKRG